MENMTYAHPFRSFRAPSEAFNFQSDASLARVIFSLFVAFLNEAIDKNRVMSKPGWEFRGSSESPTFLRKRHVLGAEPS